MDETPSEPRLGRAPPGTGSRRSTYAVVGGARAWVADARGAAMTGVGRVDTAGAVRAKRTGATVTGIGRQGTTPQCPGQQAPV